MCVNYLSTCIWCVIYNFAQLKLPFEEQTKEFELKIITGKQKFHIEKALSCDCLALLHDEWLQSAN